VQTSGWFKNVCLVLVFFMIAACAPTTPLPQPRRVVNPSEVTGAVKTEQWDLAALRYKYYGQGMDYGRAGLDPVFLVFANKSEQTPYVLLEEVRGLGAEGEFMVYTPDEAARLVYASENFRQTARNAARTGAFTAAVGASLGALIALLGNDDVLRGAGYGAAIGGLGGAVATVPDAQARLRRIVDREL